MKKLSVIAAILLCLLGMANKADAQVRKPAPKMTIEPLDKWTFFKDVEECKAAYKSGQFRYYLPKKQVPLADAKGTPVPMCVLEDIRDEPKPKFEDVRKDIPGRQAWVIHNVGTPEIYNEAGVCTADGRCLNKIHKSEELPLPQGKDGRDGVDGKDGKDGRDGVDGKNGRDGVDGKDGKDGVFKMPEPKKKGPSPWGIVVGGSIGRTSGLAPGLVSSLSRIDVCAIEGAGFKAGIAHESGLRLMVTMNAIDNGSSTLVYCQNCQTQVRNIAQGLNSVGVQAEYVKTFTDWGWKPYGGISAGAEVLSGNIRQEAGPIGGRATSVQTAGPEEFLGSKTVFVYGVRGGLAKDVGRFVFEPGFGWEYYRGFVVTATVVYRFWD